MQVLPEGGAQSPRNSRKLRRFELDAAATLVLVHVAVSLPCRLKDISLGGCRLHFDRPFHAGALARVEVLFRVDGMTHRLAGVTQWTDGCNLAGIRFVDLTERRFNELAQMLFESEAEKRRRGDPMTLAKPEPVSLVYDEESAAEADRGAAMEIQSTAASANEHAAFPSAAPRKDHVGSLRSGYKDEEMPVGQFIERRIHPRLAIDTSVVLHLVDLAVRLEGRIADISLGGCLIQTRREFSLGIYRRVETEFRLHGLPFRLAGVTQALYSKHSIGIRFLDMSGRKRAQLTELIGEVMEHGSESTTTGEGTRDSRLENEKPSPAVRWPPRT